MWGAEGSGAPVSPRPPGETGSERPKGSAGGRPPAPQRVARASAGHNGPAGRADGLGRAAERERETGSGRRGGGPGGPAASRARGEALAVDRGFPTTDPTKTRRESWLSPAGWWGRTEEKVAGSLLRAARRRHHGGGGGDPDPPHAGKSPLPAAARARPRGQRQPCGPAPEWRRRRRWKSGALKGEGGDATEEKVGFGSVSFYRVGGAPVLAGARVAERAGSRGPGPGGGVLPRAELAGSLPAPRPGLSRTASPSSSRLPARSRSLD